MSNDKTKVIIVTNSKSYIGIDSFSKSLENSKNLSNKMINYFAASALFYGYDENKIGSFLVNEVLNSNIENNKDPKLNLDISDIEKIIDKKNILNTKKLEEFDKNIENANIHNTGCYSYIENDDYTIMLFYWDKVKEVFKEAKLPEKIICLDLFLNYLTTDFIEDNDTMKNFNDEKGIAYIHDKQLFSTITAAYFDDVILNKEFTKDYYKDKFECLNKYFNYVAAFGHSTDTGSIFQSILKFEFGERIVDLINNLEDSEDSFCKLWQKVNLLITKTD